MSGLKKMAFIFTQGVSTLFRHKFNLWDYVDDIERNGWILTISDGARFYLPDCRYDNIQMEIARDDDYYSIESLQYLERNFLKPGMNILDIGANIGNHTVFFARRCGANRVYSFEPQENIFQILKRNVELNRLENVCSIYNQALGCEKGTARIASFNPNNSGGTSIAMDRGGGIQVLRLDDFELPKIDFIKIDVEGFEYDVLRGARKLLERDKPILFVEIKDAHLNGVDGLLTACGYRKAEQLGEDYIYNVADS